MKSNCRETYMYEVGNKTYKGVLRMLDVFQSVSLWNLLVPSFGTCLDVKSMRWMSGDVDEF
jgi:hypothetical protein